MTKDSCTELRGAPLWDINTETFPKANKLQLSILKLLRQTTEFHAGAFERYEAQQLATMAGTITSLPDNHWITELKMWESIAWAGIQISITDYAIGPTIRDSLAEDIFLPPSTNEEKKLCTMQKMRKPGGFV